MKPTDRPIRVGVSSCLLGEEVRYDGGHKHDRWVTGALGPFVEFVAVCPEVEIGLGTPRPTIRLQEGGPEGPRLVEPKGGVDLTDRMSRYAEKRVRALESEDLCGYILKKNSPSCGMERVKVWNRNGSGNRRDGRGLFAEALIRRFPLLPVEEEGRLEDPPLRENFVERLFAFRRVGDLFRGRWTVGDLVRFHTGEKYLLLAHDPEGYRRLGRLVAGAKGRPRDEVVREYREGYMGTLKVLATTRKHVNVLEHMVGFLRDRLGEDERAELRGVIGDFRAGLVPLVVPVTLVRHHVRRHDVAWLRDQVYLSPHPKELMLRNHT